MSDCRLPYAIAASAMRRNDTSTSTLPKSKPRNMQPHTCAGCRYGLPRPEAKEGMPLICYGRPPVPMLVPMPPTVATRGQQGVQMQMVRPIVMPEETACAMYEMKLSAMS